MNKAKIRPICADVGDQARQIWSPKTPVRRHCLPYVYVVTSIFRLLFPGFDPPPTVESAGVRPASEHVAVEDIPILKRDFARLAQLSATRRELERARAQRDGYFDCQQAARLLGVPPNTVRSWASQGLLDKAPHLSEEHYTRESVAALYERIYQHPLDLSILDREK